ncbi:hypothetical protein J5N97_002720 [Dioscorea zingiberensis]|uniref:Uncharacterized protein n=1 Tax=Dioscorea zingiberensis TaxID=325984 RepID=A0A9D5HPN9_9LILI|nr:hypothetical protein J5N97_002720 [Dioscorea zingiberensis]
MAKLLILFFFSYFSLFSFSFSLTIPTRSESEVRLLYEGWIIKHGKSYNGLLEKEQRYEIFKDNLKYIDEHNVGNHSFRLGLNVFADITNDEYRNTYLGLVAPTSKQELYHKKSDRYLFNVSKDRLPESIDWRQKGAVVPVKQQGGCFSCWAFSKKKRVVSIDDYEQVPEDNENSLKKAVANQPISAGIEGYGRAFQLYESGVFSKFCGTKIDHAVAIVGYGDEEGKEYWLIKNSFGKTWGEDGYMRLQRNVPSRNGKCGIAMWPYYPVKKKRSFEGKDNLLEVKAKHQSPTDWSTDSEGKTTII